jgi:hypothetical protein
MRIITYCYSSIDKFHIQNNQLSIRNALALPDAFALLGNAYPIDIAKHYAICWKKRKTARRYKLKKMQAVCRRKIVEL